MKKGPEGPFLRLERVMGIEPTLFAWEAKVLPLNYTREAADYRQQGIPSREETRASSHLPSIRRQKQ